MLTDESRSNSNSRVACVASTWPRGGIADVFNYKMTRQSVGEDRGHGVFPSMGHVQWLTADFSHSVERNPLRGESWHVGI